MSLPFSATLLKNRAFLKLSGPEVLQFLQGLCSADVLQLSCQGALYTTLLTPQGKVLFDFFLYRDHNDGASQNVFLESNKDLAPVLQNKLNMYKLKRKIDISPTPSYACAVGDLPLKHSKIFTFQDPRSPLLGHRFFGERSLLQENFLDQPETYTTFLFEKGIFPEITPQESGLYFPFELNLDLVGALSYNKGCYVGQEVISRVHHKGSIRSRLFTVSCESFPQDLPAPLVHAGKHIGHLIIAYKHYGLGILRTEVVNLLKKKEDEFIFCKNFHLKIKNLEKE